MNTAISTPTTAGCKVASYGARHGRRSSHCRSNVKAAAAATASRSTESTDYYKLLSLEHSSDVGADDVKRAYRRLALQYHPDVCPPSRRAESTELFVEIRRAYETLSDPITRVRYDAELRTGYTAARPAADGFPRDVWEAQLGLLRARSERRQNARRRCSGNRL
ncbi:chaperone protein dnaJ 20, chloroplastic [Lolium perenne]|jgi:curved DNA-binding protein CbpA|uniref:chaperone protein dnaJ 20, chloroplastic n=1 Tax=Lolium perenne TaxID=4522 RepID=UPI0021EA460F|nr:chaperone protein dnaJ 20, chloroplastic-like [Lolium perenne]